MASTFLRDKEIGKPQILQAIDKAYILSLFLKGIHLYQVLKCIFINFMSLLFLFSGLQVSQFMVKNYALFLIGVQIGSLFALLFVLLSLIIFVPFYLVLRRRFYNPIIIFLLCTPFSTPCIFMGCESDRENSAYNRQSQSLAPPVSL